MRSFTDTSGCRSVGSVMEWKVTQMLDASYHGGAK